MFKVTITIILTLLIFSACTPKKIFTLEELVPPQVFTPAASQEFFDHPPLYIPKGNRKTIEVYSPHFTLAIPNAMDMTGSSIELQRSLADMLCTELFNFQGIPNRRRIEILDRGALIYVDPAIIMKSINAPQRNSTNQETKIPFREKNAGNNINISTQSPGQTSPESNQIDDDYIKKLEAYLKNADGFLLSYITFRNDEKKYFEVDYRIVIKKGFIKNVVLLADTKKIRYSSISAKDIQITRNDLQEIAKSIYQYMALKPKISKETGPEISVNPKIIKFDPPNIVINIGKEQNLAPGMIGYVVELDNSVRLEGENKNETTTPTHYSYIAEFIVTDVYEKISHAVLINPESDWEVQVDDLIVIK